MRVALTIGFLLISLNGFNQTKFIHILVALCDNENQGIVPVSKAIGNGRALRTTFITTHTGLLIDGNDFIFKQDFDT